MLSFPNKPCKENWQASALPTAFFMHCRPVTRLERTASVPTSNTYIRRLLFQLGPIGLKTVSIIRLDVSKFKWRGFIAP